MSQVSIPSVAFFSSSPQPASVAPSTLENCPRILPELYLDDEHYGAIYCPDCGVKCSRRPRKLPKRRDGVDAFYFHMPGFDDVECPHRKKSGAGSSEGGEGKEKRAISLVTFGGWKSLDEDDGDNDDEDEESDTKKKREVQGGTSRGGQGFENYFDPVEGLLRSGEFRTVRRLIQLAQVSLNIAVQFEEEEAILLRDLIVSIEKVQKNPAAYMGRSLLFFGQPSSIEKGRYNRVFFNYKSPNHQLSGHCDLGIFERRNWQTSDRDRFYMFYGELDGDLEHSIVRVVEAGQIDRVSSSAHSMFNNLR